MLISISRTLEIFAIFSCSVSRERSFITMVAIDAKINSDTVILIIKYASMYVCMYYEAYANLHLNVFIYIHADLTVL